MPAKPRQPRQSRISFQSTKPEPQKAVKSQQQQPLKRIASPQPRVQPSFHEDPRVYELLNEWTDDSPKYHQNHIPLVDKLLIQFDNRMEYGPSTGISRLERFARAEHLGLRPPRILGEILAIQDSQSVYR